MSLSRILPEAEAVVQRAVRQLSRSGYMTYASGESVQSLHDGHHGEPVVVLIRGSEPEDVRGCIQIAREAHLPVYASRKQIYGDDLFGRLRPAWADAQAAAYVRH